MQAAIQRAGATDSGNLATCHAVLSNSLRYAGADAGEFEPAAVESVEMFRRTDTGHRNYPYALRTLAVARWETDLESARTLYEEVLAVAQTRGNTREVLMGLAEYGSFLSAVGELEHSLTLETQAVNVATEADDLYGLLTAQNNLACTLRMLGRVDDAAAMMRAVIGPMISLKIPSWLISLSEDYAAVLAELGRDRVAARLLGAAEASRASIGEPRSATQEHEIGGALDKARARLSPADWSAAYEQGRGEPIENTLRWALDRATS
jgi:hypothetical protein